MLPIASGEQTEPELYVLHAVSHDAPETPRIHFLEPTTAVSPANTNSIIIYFINLKKKKKEEEDNISY